MSRNKPPPPSLVSVKGDYQDALEAVLKAANMLEIGVDTALKLNQVTAAVAPDLRKLADDFRKAYFGDKS